MEEKVCFENAAVRNGNIVNRRESGLDVVFKSCGGGVSLEGAAGTKKRYITGFVTIREEHSLPMMLRFFVKGEAEESAYIRFVLLPQAKTRVCFDLGWLDLEKGGLHRTPGTLKQVIHGRRTEMDEVEKVEIGVKEVFHDVRVSFEDFCLTDEMPEDFPLPEKKLVDEFGQYKPKEWQGKVKNLQELRLVFQKNEGSAEYPFPEWNQWGGDKRRRLKEGTGFFSTFKDRDGRWHLTDPDGCDYFSMGVCGVNPGISADITHMRRQLEGLPEKGEALYEKFYKKRMHPWYPEEMEEFDYLSANLYRVYQEDWKKKWKEFASHILMGSGINSLGNWSDMNAVGVRMPYSRQLTDFPDTEERIFRDFPDVLSPEYKKNSEIFAAQLEAGKDDPWMIGYFLRNEPGFNFIPGISVANEVLRNPKDTYCRRGLIEFLKKKYRTAEALNNMWGTDFGTFDELEKPIENCMERYPGSKEDLREYSVFLVGEYCRIPSQACRKVDGNHLNMGLRWSKMNNPDMLSGWEYMDVFSFNCYSFDPVPDLEFVKKAGVDLPVLIGEYHCGALDRGLPCTGLKGVADQEQRGVMWRSFVERCAAHPSGVGAHWFQFTDEFCLGRFDGENYQIGIVDICMQPYHELTDAARETAAVLYEVKNGEKEAFGQTPKIIPMIG